MTLVAISAACVVMACGAGILRRRSAARRGKTVYSSLGRLLNQPVLAEFERDTGMRMKAARDSETTKTTGLAHRLISVKEHPQGDVFWNTEAGWTIVLKRGSRDRVVNGAAWIGITDTDDSYSLWTAPTGKTVAKCAYPSNTRVTAFRKM